MKAVKIIVAFTIAGLLSGCVVYPVGFRGGGGYYGHGHGYGYGGGYYRR